MARPLISQQPGFRSLSISRSTESPNLYLLLVEWDSVEAHTGGFRGSAGYERWKELLHHFYAALRRSWGDDPESGDDHSAFGSVTAGDA